MRSRWRKWQFPWLKRMPTIRSQLLCSLRILNPRCRFRPARLPNQCDWVAGLRIHRDLRPLKSALQAMAERCSQLGLILQGARQGLLCHLAIDMGIFRLLRVREVQGHLAAGQVERLGVEAAAATGAPATPAWDLGPDTKAVEAARTDRRAV